VASPEAETFLWRRIKSKGEQAFFKTVSRAARWGNFGLKSRRGHLRHNICQTAALKSSIPGNASTPTEPAKRCALGIRQ
jgi:hypothetical protein